MIDSNAIHTKPLRRDRPTDSRLGCRASTLGSLSIVVLSLSLVPAAGAQRAEERLAKAPELGWPREFAGEDHRLVVFQPQIRQWREYVTLEADAAILLTPPGREKPVAGAVALRAQTDTHQATRTVFIHDLELIDIRLPEIDGISRRALEDLVRAAFPSKPLAFSLDRILAGIAAAEVQGRRVELNAEAPTFFVSQAPALLVVLDGEPAWVPTGVEGLSFAANTNWDLFRFRKKKPNHWRFYLRVGAGWLGNDTLDGSWSAAGKLPRAFKKLPNNESFNEVKANVPGRDLDVVPTVFVTTEPAELIVLDGSLRLVSIPDTRLLVVENTESDLFRLIDNGQYYFLVTGRWFENDDLDGPWTAATGALPAAFATIPEDHSKGHVLASVPGTPQAEEAVLQAQIPTVAVVSRAEAPKEVFVAYLGEPAFRAIEGTALAYAVNTSSDVIRANDTYYLCADGVWFVGQSPAGPWRVADEIPKSIYEIPASSPVHHTSYVYVYDTTTETVTYGYAPGYVGLYVAWGCVVWGTGWYYPPYYYWGPGYGYPIYHPYPYTYGAAAWYNPSTGFYGRGHAAYGPYGGAGRGAVYNPKTGAYARGGFAYGPGGAAAWGQAHNPRTGTMAAGYRSSNAYSSWGRGVVTRGDQWLQSGYYSDARGSVRGFRDASGRAGAVIRGDERQGAVFRGKDDLFVGGDGEVYRRNDDGWYKYGKGGEWDKVGDQLTPEQRQGMRDFKGSRDGSAARNRSGTGSTLRDLDRSALERQRGNVRSEQFRNWKSQGGWSGVRREGGARARGTRGGGGRRGGGRQGGP